MPDNETVNSVPVATRKVTYSGDANQNAQVIGLVAFSGADDAKTAADLPGDAANGLDVDVTRLPSLAAGTNNIGDVDVLTLPTSGTATTSNVNDTASSTTLLASNASRKGASIFNDSSSTLYVKCGASASTTSYTVKLEQNDYWEVPAGYTGIIDGIWSADSSGAARVTEYT